MQLDIDNWLHSSFVAKWILTLLEFVRPPKDKVQLKSSHIHTTGQHCWIIIRTWVSPEPYVNNERLCAGSDNNLPHHIFGLNLLLKDDWHLTHHDSAIHVLRPHSHKEQHHWTCPPWEIPQILHRVQLHLQLHFLQVCPIAQLPQPSILWKGVPYEYECHVCWVVVRHVVIDWAETGQVLSKTVQKVTHRK